MNARKVVAAVVAVIAMLVGAVAVGGAAEAGTSHAKVCVEKKGWKVPSRSLALCDAVAAQRAYEVRGSGWAPGAGLVRECRADAKSEAREYGRKDGDRYVTSCLWGQHRDWLNAQPRK